MTLFTISDASDPRLNPYGNIRERDIVGRDGNFIAEGKVVLTVLLGSSFFQAQSVLVLESRLAGLADLLETAHPDLPVYVVKATIMDSIAGFAVHRGILAIGEKRGSQSLPDAYASFSENAVVVVAAGISNHDNMGSIFRNAAAFAAQAIILDNKCCDPLYRKSIRVSVGATFKVPFFKSGAIEAIASDLIENGFSLAALSPAGTKSIVDLPKTGKRALILGSEGDGLPAELLTKLSAWTIPMAADFDSLNVATASGIALFHASRFSR